MKFGRALRHTAALLAVALVIGCGLDRATTAPPAQADLIGGTLGTVTGAVGSLLQCSPLPAVNTSKVIGSDGGYLQVGPHLLVIPPRALPGPTTITASAPSNNANDIQFGPAGLHFQKSAALTMSYANCGLVAGLLPRIAYTTDLLAILYYIPSVNVSKNKSVTGKLDHFSRYAVSY